MRKLMIVYEHTDDQKETAKPRVDLVFAIEQQLRTEKGALLVDKSSSSIEFFIIWIRKKKFRIRFCFQ